MHPGELFRIIDTGSGYRRIVKGLSYKGFADRESGVIYICFQGSGGLRDWLNNVPEISLDATEPYRGCGWFVSWGLKRVWRGGNDAVIEDARELLRKFQNGAPLPGGGTKALEPVFCGFGGGAALAQLAAEDYNFRFGRVCDCVCFGSTKVAWGDVSKRHLQRAMRLTNWINRADVVTSVPLRMFGYGHVREDFVNARAASVFGKCGNRRVYGKREIYP